MEGLEVSGKAMIRVPKRWLANIPSPGGNNIHGAALNKHIGLTIRFGVKDRSQWVQSSGDKRKVAQQALAPVHRSKFHEELTTMLIALVPEVRNSRCRSCPRDEPSDTCVYTSLAMLPKDKQSYTQEQRGSNSSVPKRLNKCVGYLQPRGKHRIRSAYPSNSSGVD